MKRFANLLSLSSSLAKGGTNREHAVCSVVCSAGLYSSDWGHICLPDETEKAEQRWTSAACWGIVVRPNTSWHHRDDNLRFWLRWFTAAGSTLDRKTNSTGESDRKRSIRTSLAWTMARRKCCRENLFEPWRMLLDTRGWNLPNGDVATWQHSRVHRRWQQG